MSEVENDYDRILLYTPKLSAFGHPDVVVHHFIGYSESESYIKSGHYYEAPPPPTPVFLFNLVVPRGGK
jgi:hypothetical protein